MPHKEYEHRGYIFFLKNMTGSKIPQVKSVRESCDNIHSCCFVHFTWQRLTRGYFMFDVDRENKIMFP